jgi:hypothetical protein
LAGYALPLLVGWQAYQHDTGPVAVNPDMRHTGPPDAVLPDAAEPFDFPDHASVT